MAFNAKRNNVAAFTQGAWVLIMGGAFKIARAGNPDYEKALEDSGYRKAEAPEDKQRCLYEAVAKGIIKDWDEVVDAEDKPIPFTPENVVTVLEENPDLLNKILSEANDLSNFRRQDLENQAKKPVTGSGSRKSGDQGQKPSESSAA